MKFGAEIQLIFNSMYYITSRCIFQQKNAVIQSDIKIQSTVKSK